MGRLRPGPKRIFWGPLYNAYNKEHSTGNLRPLYYTFSIRFGLTEWPCTMCRTSIRAAVAKRDTCVRFANTGELPWSTLRRHSGELTPGSTAFQY